MSVVEQEDLGAPQLGRLDRRPLLRERVLGARRQDERVARDHLALDVSHVGFERDQRRIDLSGVEVGEQVRRLLLPPREREAREARADLGRDARQEVGGDGGDDADAERADPRISRALPGLDEVVGLDKEPSGAIDQLPPRHREEHAPAVALEQARAEALLELRELGAQRRLRDVAPPRRGGRRAAVGDGDDVLELPKSVTGAATGACRQGRSITGVIGHPYRSLRHEVLARELAPRPSFLPQEQPMLETRRRRWPMDERR